MDDLLFHKEEQHAWKEGIESYSLMPFVSELQKVYTFKRRFKYQLDAMT